MENLNKDAVEVALYIIKNDLNVPLPLQEEDLEYLCHKNIVEFDYDTGKYKLCERNVRFKESIDRIPEYRVLFSEESIGVNKAATPAQIKNKLIRFLEEYPEYNMDDIIAAAKAHIQETNAKYVKRADNFLFKKENNSVWVSLAYEYIQKNKEYKQVTSNLFI